MCPEKSESWWEQCLVPHSVVLTVYQTVVLTVVQWGVKMVVPTVDQSVVLTVVPWGVKMVVQSVVQ